MYLANRAGGHKAQESLWKLLEKGVVTLYIGSARELERMHDLMRDYHDAPMDFADASLITAAENLAVRKVFTLDRHFRAYRIAGEHAFEVIP